MGLRAGTWLAGGIAALVAGALFVALRPDDADVEPVGDVLETESVPATVTLDAGRPGAEVPAQPAAETGNPQERPGSVRMRVVRAPDDAPVPGIPVFLRRDVAPRGPFHLLAWTDERGLVVFPEVWPGTGLRLRVQAGAGPRVERDDVVVRAGEATDLGDVRLGPLGLVDALVVDETGKPIEDARVAATLDPETIASLDTDAFPLPPDPPSPVAAGRSDNHGRVRLEGVPPGIVALRATKPPLRGATDRVRVPAAGADSAVVTIVLRPGALAGLVVIADGRPVADLPVRFGEERLDDFFVRGTAITDAEGVAILGGFARYVRFDAEFEVPGRGTFVVAGLGVGGGDRVTLGTVGRYAVLVVDEAGRPVAGARVGARSTATRTRVLAPPPRRDRPPPDRVAPRPSVDVVGVTGADGRVTLDTGGPPSGIWAVHPDYLAYGDPPAFRADPGWTPSAVRDGPTDATPTIVLRRGVDVVGRVIDAQRRPAVGAVVRAVDLDQQGTSSALVDERGEYVLAGVRPERTPWVVATRSLPEVVGVVRLGVARSPSRDREADLTLREPSRVRGTVLDANGVAIEGARVVVEGTPLETLTDRRGAFVLGPLALHLGGSDRPMVVVATVAGLGSVRASAPWPPFGRNAELPDLRLGDGKDVDGYVLDPARNAVPFPLVELTDANGRGIARLVAADPFGRFVFRDVAPGLYSVRARARGLDGFAAGGVDVPAAPGVPPKVVPVVLKPARTIRGTVLLGRDGTPVAGATVALLGRGPSELRGVSKHDRESVLSDADGRFVFTVGYVATFVEASAPDPRQPTQWVRARELIPGDQGREVDVELELELR